MKALVYANYSKFITASTTIHQMRGKVEGMEGEMQKLAASVEKISAVSDRISGTLQSKRDQIEQLSGVHHLLQKLQFLVDLPSKLRHSIASRNYEEAVTYWRKTKTVLEKYKHCPSFTPIETQSSDIIKELTTMLSDAYFTPNASYKILVDYAPLLLDLEESHAKLRTHYVSVRLEQLSNTFNEFQSTPMVEPQPASPQQNTQSTTTPEAEAAYQSIAALNKKTSPAITEFITTFCSIFVSRLKVTPEDQLAAIFLLDKAISVLIKNYTTVVAKYLQKVASDGSSSTLPATVEKKKHDEEDDAPSKLELGSLAAPVATPSGEVLRAASECLDSLLGTYWSNVLLPSTPPDSLTRIKTKTRLGDTSKYINGFISSLLDISFEDITKDILGVISSGLDRVSSAITAHLAAEASGQSLSASAEMKKSTTTNEAIDSITTGVVSNLDDSFASKLRLLFSLCAPGSFLESSAPTLLASVQGKIQALLGQIVEQFGGVDSTNALRLLVAPLVFDALKVKALPTLASTLGKIVSQSKHSNLGTDVAVNKILEFESELSTASQRLISQHVRDTGVRLGEMLRRAIETRNWLKQAEPSGVDGAIEIVVQELTSLQKPISVLYELGPRKDRKRVLLGSITGADNKVAVTSDVEFDQLFQKKVNYFDKVEFNSRAISTAIIKIALKTYLETVRLRTYSTNGYQQLQLDIHYLNLVLDQYVSDPASLDAMMMDILNSVKERCVQPFSMDLPIIAKLCSEAFAKHNGTPVPQPTT
jgi:hypothetical protein